MDSSDGTDRSAFAPYQVQLALVGALYFGTTRLGLTMAFGAEQVTAVWPPTGIALAALFLLGYRLWPAITLGAFLANVAVNVPAGPAAGIAAGNTLEAVLGAWLLRRAGFDPSLGRARDVLALVLLAAGMSTAASATVGAVSLCAGGVRPWAADLTIWGRWWLGDAMGDLVVAPLLFAWAAWQPPRWQRGRVGEAGVLLLALVVVSLTVFAAPPAFYLHPLAYTIFPFAIWAALRHGQPVATLMTAVASGIAIWGTAHGAGPFGAMRAHERLAQLQIFLGAVAVTALLLAAVTAERERASEAARESRDELALTLAAARVGAWSWDQPTGKVLWSGNLEELHGLPPGTFGGTFEALLEGVHPEDRGRALQALRAAMEQARDFEVEYRAAGPDGPPRWVGCRGRVTYGGDERPRGLRGACADITGRKQAEEALQQSYDLVRAVIEGTTDAVYVKDRQGRYLMINAAGAGFLGKAVAEVIGKDDTELFSPETAREIMEGDRRVMATGETQTREDVGTAAGLTRTYLSTKGPYRDARGDIVGVVGISHDITQRKRAERWWAAAHAVTCALARSANLEEAVAPVLHTLGEALRCDLGVFWKMDGAGGVLRCALVWRAPGAEASEFEQFSRQITFARGEGLPGRAWDMGKAAWVAEAPFPRSLAARRDEPHAALAFPVLGEGALFGVLEFFSPELRQPDENLFPMVAGLGSQIAQFIERRHAEMVVHMRARELSLAGKIQQNLLPKGPPQLPGLMAAGACHPAQETGGDYFDFIPLAGGHWGVALGDASGHGIAAALLIAEARAYLRAFTLTGACPGEALGGANRRLVEDVSSGYFVTLFLARLEPQEFRLVYSNAGHLPGHVLGADGEVKMALPSTAPPLGVNPASDFPIGPPACLEPGDMLLLLSDGIVEARSGDRRQFGMGRALEVVRARRHEAPGDIIAALVEEARAWSHGGQADDMTAVVIKRC